MAKFKFMESDTIPDAYRELVPTYKSQVFGALHLTINRWNNEFGREVANVNPKRAQNRCTNYLDVEELDRVRSRLSLGKDSSLRFGVSKAGRGYHGERGDFCLVGGAIDGRHLSLMYRSLEMIGGFGYDLAMIAEMCERLGWEPRGVTIMAARANVFALKRNSNEKFYPKLWKILGLPTAAGQPAQGVHKEK